MSEAKRQFLPVDEQLKLILRGVVECYSEPDLRRKLEVSRASGKPLRVKLGLDPNRPDIHIGHTVVLRKLRQFQQLGHHAVLIIGDATAMVGDPSGRSKTRPAMSEEEVQAAAKTYIDQVGAVIDTKETEVRRNGEWFSKMGFSDVMKLAGSTTVARLLERDDFAKRYKGNQPISLHEFFYPLMQGHDSVAIQADIELGGTDQTFNLLVGRALQERVNMEPQVCLTTPLLPGLDGVEKMSKSLGNTIDVRALPDDMFGKTMSIADAMMSAWLTLLTDVPQADIKRLCDPAQTHPREAKDRLAREITAFFHNEAAAEAASAEFRRRFAEHALPSDMPTHKPSAPRMSIIDLLIEVGFAKSKGEARRLIEQGGVGIIDGAGADDGVTPALDAAIDCKPGLVIRAGKRRFVRLA